MMPETPFVNELMRKLQLMLPPEYRSICAPAKYIEGVWRPTMVDPGIKFHFSEHIPTFNSQVGYSIGSSYSSINQELRKRMSFAGEYSFIGTILSKGKVPEQFEDMVKNFNKTEVTASYLDSIKESDVLLSHLDREIDEDLWINIAHSRQLNPVLNSSINLTFWRNKIEKDWAVFLPQMGMTDELDFVKTIRAKHTTDNIIRLAQANARGEGREEIQERDLNEGRKIFTSSAEELIKHPIIQRAIPIIKQQKEQDRIHSIKVLLESGTMTLDELWEQLRDTSYYSGKSDLENVIDWLHKSGFIILERTGYYWI